MNSAAVLLLPISHPILAQREIAASGLSKFCKAKGNCSLARRHIHESVKAWKKGNKPQPKKERDKNENTNINFN
jgi:hypothetical protein